MPLNAASGAAEEIQKLKISDAQFAQLLGLSKATICRWFNGTAKPTPAQELMLADAVADIKELFRKLHPIRPDLSQPENARAVLKLLRQKQLWVSVHEIGYEEAYNYTKDEIAAAQVKFDAGVNALAKEILNVEPPGSS